MLTFLSIMALNNWIRLLIMVPVNLSSLFPLSVLSFYLEDSLSVNQSKNSFIIALDTTHYSSFVFVPLYYSSFTFLYKFSSAGHHNRYVIIILIYYLLMDFTQNNSRNGYLNNFIFLFQKLHTN